MPQSSLTKRGAGPLLTIARGCVILSHCPMRIVITAPSLDESRNVSGISTVVRQIIEFSPHEFVHFKAGREDGERLGARWAARQATLPFRFYSRLRRIRPDLVHINTALTDRSIWRDMFLAEAAKRARVPIVLAVHGGKYLVEAPDDPKVERAARRLLGSAASVVVLSSTEKASLERRWPGLDIRILPNAVPIRDEPARSVNDTPVVIFFGRLHESKGLNEIVKASAELLNAGYEFRFRCFGDGPEREAFLSRISAVLGDRFEYGGVVGGTDKFKALDSADIFLLPSLYGEGLPMALLEAMASGCLVVASEMASVAEVIVDGVNGYLIEPGNTAQLVERMKHVLNDKKGWESIRKEAMRTVRDRFSIAEYVDRLDTIYEAAAAKNDK